MAQDYAIRWKLTPLSSLYGYSGVNQDDLVRDDSDEVMYLEQDDAIATAKELQDRTHNVSYTVEHRPADGVYA